MHIRDQYDIIVIGGGPAGLSSAATARNEGAGSVLLIERDLTLGGILPQCIHTGFGLAEFKEELTGPEYANRWIRNAIDAGVDILTGTMVLSISREKEVTVMGSLTGITSIKAKSIILAMGCREKTRGALCIAGSRPAGIYTAGCAQRLVNIEGYLPGKKIFILGSGDIGLIMARRLTLEGAEVVAVCEKADHPGGLERNVQQCLRDFGIPLILSSTIVEIHGRKRVESVTIARFSKDNKPVPGTFETIPCDTVLLSVGLIPENELSRDIHIKMDNKTGGPVVDAIMQTSVPGIFACGNVLQVYDLVDHVTEDAIKAGRSAWEYVKSGFEDGLKATGGTETEVPAEIDDASDTAEAVDDRSDFSANKDYREITCTICPVGCNIRMWRDDSGEWRIDGNKCKRGFQYAMDEITDPKRTLTTTMLQRIQHDEAGTEVFTDRLIAVRSNHPIPLRQTLSAMDQIKETIVCKPVKEGDVVITDVAGTKADMIVTRA
ncbi:MAG: FAD-dependent oxidoreductase [Saccharofermentanales bacterium]